MRPRPLLTMVTACCIFLAVASPSTARLVSASTEEREKKVFFGEILSQARLTLAPCPFVSDKVKKVFGEQFQPLFVAVVLEITKIDGEIDSIKIFISVEGEVDLQELVTLNKKDNDADCKVLVEKLRLT